MKVVIDTNVIASSLMNSDGAPGKIVKYFRANVFELLVSSDIMNEYWQTLNCEKVSRLHKMNPEEVGLFLSELRSASLTGFITIRINAVPNDPKDDKFIESAVAGNADFIVSGDRHLLSLREYDGIKIVTPATFVAYLSSEHAIK